ncbi:hypothetical protein MHYP_G00080600 [Metynnis hypsauchen]
MKECAWLHRFTPQSLYSRGSSLSRDRQSERGRVGCACVSFGSSTESSAWLCKIHDTQMSQDRQVLFFGQARLTYALRLKIVRHGNQ